MMLYVKCLASKGKAEIGKGDFIVKVSTTYYMQIQYICNAGADAQYYNGKKIELLK